MFMGGLGFCQTHEKAKPRCAGYLLICPEIMQILPEKRTDGFSASTIDASCGIFHDRASEPQSCDVIGAAVSPRCVALNGKLVLKIRRFVGLPWSLFSAVKRAMCSHGYTPSEVWAIQNDLTRFGTQVKTHRLARWCFQDIGSAAYAYRRPFAGNSELPTLPPRTATKKTPSF